MPRIAIAEDDPACRKQFCALAQQYEARHSLALAVDCFESGFALLEQYHGGYDAVFLDILMPHMDGLETAHRLRDVDEDVPILFVTTVAQYAIRGYEVCAMGFMIKPVSYEEFELKMNRVLRQSAHHRPSIYPINQGGMVKLVSVTEIQYVEIYNHSLIFHTRDGAYTAYGQLKTLEQDERFVRFAKSSPSHLVNCGWVSEVGADSVTVAGAVLPLSRRRRKTFLEQMARIVGGGL